MEYLVRNEKGQWEICRAGVFFRPNVDDIAPHFTAWADRRGAFHCTNENAVDVRELPE